MRIRVSGQALGSYRGPLLAAGLFEGQKLEESPLNELDLASGGWLKRLLAAGDFRGKKDEVLVQRTMGALPFQRLMLVGLGRRERFKVDTWRGALSTVARRCREMRLEEFAVAMNFPEGKGMERETMAWASVEGILLGLYRFKGFKSKEDEELRDPTEAILLVRGRASGKLEKAIREAQIVSEAVCWVRDLVGMPSNKLTPQILADEALKMCKGRGLKCKVLDEKEMRALGMGALLGVASGSKEPPRLIVVEHGKPSRTTPTIALVGKGITFDSGGISLKPAEKMDQMKDDMAGGAAVLGTLRAASELGLPLHLVGIVPATENLPSGSAYKPGDVLTTMSGQTIEVSNTDAEGRLILADAIAFALRYKPKVLIDVATLTGACIVALGDSIAGIMGNDLRLLEKLREAGERTGEEVWPLPLKEEYEELIKSEIADVKNAGGREAGAIQGGLFLKKFVGDTPWVHLDIAGPVWTEKERPYRPKGPTGFGVRLLVEFLRNYG